MKCLIGLIKMIKNKPRLEITRHCDKHVGVNNRKGFTLIEIVISIAILALIAAPVLNMFAASTQNTILSAKVTAASYICQSEMERLIKFDYFSLLADSKQFYNNTSNELIVKTSSDGSNPHIGYTVRITPSGTHEDLVPVGVTSNYIHMVFYNTTGVADRSLSVFYPDGRSDIITPLGATVEIAPLASNPLYSHKIIAGNPSVTKSFKTDTGSQIIIISNLGKMLSTSAGSSLRLSAFTSLSMPKVVFYANEKTTIDKYVVIPAPSMTASQTYIGGELFDKMLVTINIDAYWIRGATKTKIASLHNTISPKIIIPTP